MSRFKMVKFRTAIWVIVSAFSLQSRAEMFENFPLHFRLAAEICVANNADNLQCQKTPFEDDEILQLKDYVPGQMLRGSLIKEIEIPCGLEEGEKGLQTISAEIIIDKVFRDKKPYHLTLVIKNNLSFLEGKFASSPSKVFTHSFSEPSQFPRLTFDSEICYLKNGFSSYQVKISPPWR